MKLGLDEIKVNGRHRKELGDIDGLAESMGRALLHPVVITEDHKLIAGERRIAAARKLGWKEIEVRIVRSLNDALSLLLAERDENTCRKKFTPSEAVAVGESLEAIEKPKAKERKAQAKGEPRGKKKAGDSGGKLPPEKTRDRVATGVEGGGGGRFGYGGDAEGRVERFASRRGACCFDPGGRMNPTFSELPRPVPVACSAASPGRDRTERGRDRSCLLESWDFGQTVG